MTPQEHALVNLRTARAFLQASGLGLGRIALASLLAGEASTTARCGRRVGGGSVRAQAGSLCSARKAVVHLFMAGGPSHLDLFDYKPQLAKYEGKQIPPEVIGGQRYAFIRSDAGRLGPRFKFDKHGQCGTEIAEVLPHLAGVVDDVCLVRSVRTDQFNHAPAQVFFNTGFSQPGPAQHGLLGRVRAGGRDAATCRPSS